MDSIYIFDKDDNLLLILNDNEILSYNHVKSTGAESTFTFKLNNKNNLIKKYNKAGFIKNDELQLFIIDDVEEYNSLTENTIEATCIDDITDLSRKIIEDKRVVNDKANVALSKALEGTGYEVGIVESFENHDINFYFISSLKALNDILETYSCEFKTRIIIDDNGKITHKYVDLVHHLGEDTGLRFSYDTNLSYIQRNIADSSHFNVLYGRGKSLETDDGGYSRKLTFNDVTWYTPIHPTNKPSNQKYIEDAESISKYGRLEGIYENDNIEDAEILLQETYNKLLDVKDIKYSYSISVDDLRGFDGFEHYNYKFGDTIIVLDESENIVIEARIIEINNKVEKENEEITESTLLTLGNFRAGLVETDNIDDVISNIKDKIENVTSDVSDSDFPNTLPDVPILSGQSFFANISLSWTYENKLYYAYELYASKIKDFTPDSTNRIFEGKASSYTHETKCDETWYYRVRAKNSHGMYTQYSSQLQISTFKIEDGTEFFKSAAIQDALIGTLKLDRGWVGKLTGDLIEAKELKVIDGNNNVTFYIDSFGRVYLDVTSLTINSQEIATEEYMQSLLKITKDELNNKIEKANSVARDNLIRNGAFKNQLNDWIKNGEPTINLNVDYLNPSYGAMSLIIANTGEGLYQYFKTVPGQTYTISFYAECDGKIPCHTRVGIQDTELINLYDTPEFRQYTYTFTAWNTSHPFLIYSNQENAKFFIGRIMINVGDTAFPFSNNLDEVAAIQKSNSEIKQTLDSISNTVKKVEGDYTSKTVFEQTVKDFDFRFENTGGDNLVLNSNFSGGTEWWTCVNGAILTPKANWLDASYGEVARVTSDNYNGGINQYLRTIPGQVYTVSFYAEAEGRQPLSTKIGILDSTTIDLKYSPGFQRYSFTFTAWNTIHPFIAYTFGQKGTFYIGRIMVTPGATLQEYRKSSSEIFTNNTKISPAGVTIEHENGSSTNIDAKEMSFMDFTGKKIMRIKGQGLEYISPSTGTWTGFIKSSMRENGRGVSLACSGLGNYMSFGSTKETDADANWSTSSAMTIENRYNGVWWPGIHFWAMNTVDKDNTFVHNHTSYIQESGSMYMNNQSIFFDSYFHETPNFIGRATSGRLLVYGSDSLSLGVRHGKDNYASIVITEGGENGDTINCYSNINMNGRYIRNAQMGYTYTNLKTRSYAEDSTLRSSTSSVRYLYKDMQFKDNKLILSIPNIYKGCKYTVCSIVKKGRGDVWISEEKEDLFILKSENNIKVNIELDILINTNNNIVLSRTSNMSIDDIVENLEPVSCELSN